MRQSLSDIVIVEGNNELNVALTPIPAWATSEVTAAGASLPTWCGTCWMLCSMSITNLSGSPVPCSVALYARYFSSATDYEWTDWRELLPENLSSYRDAVSDYQAALDLYNQLTMLEATLAPGETKVFSGVVPNMTKKVTGMPRMQVKFVGPFGEVVMEGYFQMVEY